MDLPADASFVLVEIGARSLAQHRAWLQILDDTTRRDALSHRLRQGMAIPKASLFSTLLQHWCALTRDALTPDAGLQVAVSPLKPLIQPQVKKWLELFDKGVISPKELRPYANPRVLLFLLPLLTPSLPKPGAVRSLLRWNSRGYGIPFMKLDHLVRGGEAASGGHSMREPATPQSLHVLLQFS